MQTLRPNPFKPNETASRWLRGMSVVLMILATAFFLCTSWMTLNAYDAERGIPIGYLRFDDWFYPWLGCLTVYFLARLALRIVWSVWMARCYTNYAESYTGTPEERKEMISYCAFIPLLNLYYPWKATEEMQRRYHFLRYWLPIGQTPPAPPHSLLNAWWGCMLGGIAMAALGLGNMMLLEPFLCCLFLLAMTAFQFTSAFLLLLLVSRMEMLETAVRLRWEKGAFDPLYEQLNRGQLRALPPHMQETVVSLTPPEPDAADGPFS